MELWADEFDDDLYQRLEEQQVETEMLHQRVSVLEAEVRDLQAVVKKLSPPRAAAPSPLSSLDWQRQLAEEHKQFEENLKRQEAELVRLKSEMVAAALAAKRMASGAAAGATGAAAAPAATPATAAPAASDADPLAELRRVMAACRKDVHAAHVHRTGRNFIIQGLPDLHGGEREGALRERVVAALRDTGVLTDSDGGEAVAEVRRLGRHRVPGKSRPVLVSLAAETLLPRVFKRKSSVQRALCAKIDNDLSCDERQQRAALASVVKELHARGLRPHWRFRAVLHYYLHGGSTPVAYDGKSDLPPPAPAA